MTTANEILRSMDVERFGAVLAASPKGFREELFRRAGVRVKSEAFSVKNLSKNQVRIEKLLAALRNGADIADDALGEVIRNYLYTRRAMLADALDHLKVKHDNGLTDEDLGFLDDLPREKREELKRLLETKYDPQDVALYLAFMNIAA